MLGFGDRDGVTITHVGVQHYMHVGAAIADVHDVVGAYLCAGLQLIEDEYFAIASGCTCDRINLAVFFVEKLGAKNMVNGNNAFES